MMIVHADCREHMATMDANSVDAIVTDPPYGLSFMGKGWDKGVPGVEFWQAAFRVMKPGAYLLAFGGSRTFHRMAVAIEDAGFEIRDTLSWLYGSGFPKSHDVGKAIDKLAGAEREVVGLNPNIAGRKFGQGHHEGWERPWMQNDDADARKITAPATDAAKQWDGWGTALKPAWEPVIVARKPLEGTVAANVLTHGTGAINVDACRIEGAKGWPDSKQYNPGFLAGGSKDTAAYQDNSANPSKQLGRWPANVVLDGEAAALLDAQSGERKAGVYKAPTARKRNNGLGLGTTDTRNGTSNAPDNYGDTGGASRFFYTAKASRSERNAGLEGMPERAAGVHDDDAYVWPLNGDGSPRGKKVAPRANHHPTVKPISLMRWLVRLVTPPGGTVLDPFAGSGTTGCAAALEGFQFIGIEQDAEYVAIAERRVAHWALQPALMEIPA